MNALGRLHLMKLRGVVHDDHRGGNTFDHRGRGIKTSKIITSTVSARI